MLIGCICTCCILCTSYHDKVVTRAPKPKWQSKRRLSTGPLRCILIHSYWQRSPSTGVRGCEVPCATRAVCGVLYAWILPVHRQLTSLSSNASFFFHIVLDPLKESQRRPGMLKRWAPVPGTACAPQDTVLHHHLARTRAKGNQSNILHLWQRKQHQPLPGHQNQRKEMETGWIYPKGQSPAMWTTMAVAVPAMMIFMLCI